MVEVNVKKVFEDFTLDVDFKSGASFTALFAPSGSGKSLTLQCIAGLVKPDEGKIVIDGKVFYDSEKNFFLKPQLRKVGYLFQDYALFPHMTVEENVFYGAKDKQFAERLFGILGIEKIRKRYPSEVSGGQKQRTALARALAVKPRLLLLDEPFSALHKSLREVLYQEIKKIASMFNLKVILVSHDIDEVFELAEYMVILRHGKVVQEGKPMDVFFEPADVDTASLLGHKSFFEGVVLDPETGEVLVGNKVKLKCRKRKGLKKGERVWVSILPFSVALTFFDSENKIEVKITDLSRKREFLEVKGLFLGKEITFHLPFTLLPNISLERGKEIEVALSSALLPVMKG
jgi:molybdate transport system ATP-binding protein